MFGKKKSCQECVKQKLVTVYDYSIETTIIGKNGEEVIILATETGQINKEEAAINGADHLYSNRSYFLKNGQNEFLSPDYYKISKISVNEIDSRQVLVDV